MRQDIVELEISASRTRRVTMIINLTIEDKSRATRNALVIERNVQSPIEMI